MARALNGSSQYLRKTASPITNYPYTVASMAYPTAVTARMVTVCLTDYDDNDDQSWAAIAGDVASDPAEWRLRNNATLQAAAGRQTTCAVNTWQHVAGVSAATNSHTARLDGASNTSTTTVAFQTGLSDIVLGAGINTASTLSYHFAGRLSEAAIWNVALTPQECIRFFSPLLIRPQSLLAYWPLGGAWGDTDKDRVGGLDLTPTGSPTSAEHSPTIYPCEAQCC